MQRVMEIIDKKRSTRNREKARGQSRATNVVDLVKVLQESLNRNQSLKPKRNGTSPAKRSTSSMVKQKRRVAA